MFPPYTASASGTGSWPKAGCCSRKIVVKRARMRRQRVMDPDSWVYSNFYFTHNNIHDKNLSKRKYAQKLTWSIFHFSFFIFHFSRCIRLTSVSLMKNVPWRMKNARYLFGHILLSRFGKFCQIHHHETIECIVEQRIDIEADDTSILANIFFEEYW